MLPYKAVAVLAALSTGVVAAPAPAIDPAVLFKRQETYVLVSSMRHLRLASIAQLYLVGAID